MKYLLDTNICIHFFRGNFNLIEIIANNLIMVTENTKEFNRIASIKLENWVKR